MYIHHQDTVGVNNFYISRYKIQQHTVPEAVYYQDSNSATCKFIASVLGSSRCCVDMLE